MAEWGKIRCDEWNHEIFFTNRDFDFFQIFSKNMTNACQLPAISKIPLTQPTSCDLVLGHRSMKFEYRIMIRTDHDVIVIFFLLWLRHVPTGTRFCECFQFASLILGTWINLESVKNLFFWAMDVIFWWILLRISSDLRQTLVDGTTTKRLKFFWDVIWTN